MTMTSSLATSTTSLALPPTTLRFLGPFSPSSSSSSSAARFLVGRRTSSTMSGDEDVSRLSLGFGGGALGIIGTEDGSENTSPFSESLQVDQLSVRLDTYLSSCIPRQDSRTHKSKMQKWIGRYFPSSSLTVNIFPRSTSSSLSVFS